VERLARMAADIAGPASDQYTPGVSAQWRST
jgi:hypothetical protein